MKVVDDYSKITLDVAICGYSEVAPTEDTLGKTINNYMHARSLKSYYSNTDMVADARRAYPGVNWRYFFTEKTPASGKSEIDFSNSTTW